MARWPGAHASSGVRGVGLCVGATFTASAQGEVWEVQAPEGPGPSATSSHTDHSRPLTAPSQCLPVQGADAEEGSAAAAAGEAEVPGSSAGEVEAGSVPTGGATLSTAIQDAGEGVTRVRSAKCRRVKVIAGAGPDLLGGPVFILLSTSRGA